MKKTITLIFLAFAIITNAQTSTADFETFTLSPNSAYTSTGSISFQTSNAIFPYLWDTQFSYWKGGFAYSNKYDSATAGSGNMYGVKPLKGYNSSNIFVIAQNKGIIKIKSPSNALDGFYITNTTYAYKSMKLGDNFAKKFGGVSGNDPDWFKVTVKGYLGGTMKTDSVVHYLADFRSSDNSQDFIVKTWQWVNTSGLGQVDSVKFFIYSSDVGNFGMNTPGFFALDNLTTATVVGLNENSLANEMSVYPNPFTSELFIALSREQNYTLRISDLCGKLVYSASFKDTDQHLQLEVLEKGIYLLELSDGENKVVKKLIKE